MEIVKDFCTKLEADDTYNDEISYELIEISICWIGITRNLLVARLQSKDLSQSEWFVAVHQMESKLSSKIYCDIINNEYKLIYYIFITMWITGSKIL